MLLSSFLPSRASSLLELSTRKGEGWAESTSRGPQQRWFEPALCKTIAQSSKYKMFIIKQFNKQTFTITWTTVLEISSACKDSWCYLGVTNFLLSNEQKDPSVFIPLNNSLCLFFFCIRHGLYFINWWFLGKLFFFPSHWHQIWPGSHCCDLGFDLWNPKLHDMWNPMLVNESGLN